jgi:phosphoribosylanthranilate isomerase
MFYSCLLKFGAVTNLTDARYAAAVYAEWIGFCLNPEHPRYISPLKVKEITDWLSGPEMVAEIDHLLPEEMLPALEILNIKTVQVDNLAVAETWSNLGYKVILNDLNATHDFISIQAMPTGKGKEIIDITEWSMEEIKALKDSGPFAININGGDETAPGIRDFAEIDEILSIFEAE